ncbi:MAG TPA: hypothetical protein VFL83_14175 [Anaeromyxobacter sp.]|nr:hypothetical protein [Anaeromyxobacter sp.]
MPRFHALRELRIEVQSAGAGLRAEVTLSKADAYPPLVASTAPEVAWDGRAAVQVDLPEPRGTPFTATAARPDGEWIDRVLERASLARVPDMDEIGAALVRGAQPLLERFFAGGPDEPVRRVAVVARDLASASLPWEALRFHGIEALARDCCTIVRRSTAPAGECTGPIDLPMSVGFAEHVVRHPLSRGWADGVFADPFVRDAAREPRRAIEWGLLGSDVKPGEIHHVPFVVGDWSGGERAERGRLREFLVALAPYDRAAGPERIVPRLLVLHGLDGRGMSAPALAPLAHFALDRGCDAVLIVVGGGIEPDAAGFFPRFYRKLLHNEPLDVCVREAAATSPVGWVFGAREAGELRLQLPGVLAEAASRVLRAVRPLEAVKMRSPPRKRMARESLPRAAPPPAREEPPTRASRSARELAARARAVAEQGAEASAAAAVGAAPRGALGAETHELDAVLNGRRAIAEAAGAVERAERAADALEAAPREPEPRLTAVWLARSDGTRIADADPVPVGAWHAALVQITPRPRPGEAVGAGSVDPVLRQIFETAESVTLDVVVFAPAKDVELGRRTAELVLPRLGESREISIGFRARRAARLQLRIGIYYRNQLLQSAVVRFRASEASAPAPADLTRELDYVASADLQLLDELPAPALSFFTNDDPSGNHWIGFFSRQDRPAGVVQASSMRALAPTDLENRAKPIRAVLDQLMALKARPDGGPVDDGGRATRERLFCNLARAGFDAYVALLADPEGDPAVQERFAEATARPGILSVARCVGQNPSLPWSAIYDLRLDSVAVLELCPVHRELLDRSPPVLPGAAECRERADCPLRADATRDSTVCPFGFWGLRHQIEQPLQAVTPTPVDRVPDELSPMTPFMFRHGGEKPTLALFAEPKLPDVQGHEDELRESGVEVVRKTDRPEVLPLLRQGGFHFVYFLCHGEVDGSGNFFLLVGPDAAHGRIGAGDLLGATWPESETLVFLNGCNTVAFLPETTNPLLRRMRGMHAAGAVGTEIRVETAVAKLVGRLVVRGLTAGSSIGEAFLEMRRALLKVRTPLGLAYSFYAPATLHLHPVEAPCSWCGTHRLPS